MLCGVRQLYDDGARRAQNLTANTARSRRPPAKRAAAHVYGGKITTYRKLAENALRRLAPFYRMGPAGPATRRCRRGLPL